MYTFQDKWPSYSSDPSDILNLDPTRTQSVDLEWNALDVPDVLGISDGKLHVTVSWDEGVEYFIHFLKQHPDIKIAGHNFIQSDLPLLEKRGIHIPLEQIDDSILWHYLVNMFLCKSSGKAALDEENGTELRGRGFMNLGTFASIYTNFPHWKTCRGEGCTGPCPKHDQMWYNAIDCASVAEGLPGVRKQALVRGVAKLYPLHRELAAVLAEMREFGVRINVPYVYSSDTHPLGSRDGNSLDEEFQREKVRIRGLLPFNPQSPKAVTDHFKSIQLADSQLETVEDAVEELGDNAPEELKLLLEYKELGNGVNRWYEPEYRDKNGWLKGYMDQAGYVHPRINPFTSSGRLACSGPNFQNVYIRKGEHIRRAVIAPDGYYIVRADLSNAENRVALHFGGYTIARDVDLHNWVKDIAGITEDMDISRREGSARQAAKKIQHANNNLEGLQLKTPEQLRSAKIRSEIAAGARKVHWDWMFRKKYVTFSGAYEAKRTFGTATFENRRKVLEVNEKYTNNFPGVIDFRKRVSKDCEVTGTVRSPLGYCLISFGDDNDRMKIAQSNQQQCPVAHVTKIALVRLWKRWERERLMRPILQIHDEIVCIAKESVDPKQAMSWLREDMEIEMQEIPGLVIPAETTYGPTWAKSDQIGEK